MQPMSAKGHFCSISAKSAWSSLVEKFCREKQTAHVHVAYYKACAAACLSLPHNCRMPHFISIFFFWSHESATVAYYNNIIIICDIIKNSIHSRQLLYSILHATIYLMSHEHSTLTFPHRVHNALLASEDERRW